MSAKASINGFNSAAAFASSSEAARENPELFRLTMKLFGPCVPDIHSGSECRSHFSIRDPSAPETKETDVFTDFRVLHNPIDVFRSPEMSQCHKIWKQERACTKFRTRMLDKLCRVQVDRYYRCVRDSESGADACMSKYGEVMQCIDNIPREQFPKKAVAKESHH